MTEAAYPVASGNLNVRSMYEAYQRMAEEINSSLSKQTIGTSTADADRWRSYIKGLRAYAAYFQSLVSTDWPVTRGRNYILDEPISPTLDGNQNTAVQDLVDMVVNARDELVVSASNELPVGLFPADMARQVSYWDSMDSLIDNYLLVVQPLDTPITSAIEITGATGPELASS